MAGNASNWYKPTSGPLKGTSVYVSAAQRAGQSRAQLRDALDRGDAASLALADVQRPAAAARPAPARMPLPDDAMTRRFAGDTFRTFTNEAQREAFGEQYWAAWVAGLSPAERDGIWVYKGGPYAQVNQHLRGLVPITDAPVLAQVEARVRAIDAAIGRARMPYNVTVYRGSGPGGSLTEDAAYTSNTLDADRARAIAKSYGGPLIITRIRRGAQAAYVEPISDRGVSEVLVHRNSRYRVIAERVEDGVRVVERELIS